MVFKNRHQDRRGDKNPRAKFSESDAAYIISEIAKGRQQNSLAKELGVSQPTISDICRGHSWKHLARPWKAERADATRRKTMTPARRKRVLSVTGGCCAACGADVTNASWVADHILPLELSGADEFSNLQALCVPCNKLKTAVDARDIGKMRRRAKKDSEPRKESGLKSRGFSKALKKKFDGTVVRR